MTDLRQLPTSTTSDNAAIPDLTVVPGLELVASTPAATRHVMGLLAAGVPLSLLFDLADPSGPPSADMLSSEQDGRSLIGDLLAFRADAAQRGARTRRRLHG